MAGRPTRLTADVSDEICRGLRAGASLHIAADSLGIPIKTVLAWRALGEAARGCDQTRCRDGHHGPRGGGLSYRIFAEELQRARGQAGLRAAASVSARFQSDPHYAERWLAKQYPEDFGPRAGTFTAETAPSGPPLTVWVTPQAAAPMWTPGAASPTPETESAE